MVTASSSASATDSNTLKGDFFYQDANHWPSISRSEMRSVEE